MSRRLVLWAASTSITVILSGCPEPMALDAGRDTPPATDANEPIDAVDADPDVLDAGDRRSDAPVDAPPLMLDAPGPADAASDVRDAMRPDAPVPSSVTFEEFIALVSPLACRASDLCVPADLFLWTHGGPDCDHVEVSPGLYALERQLVASGTLRFDPALAAACLQFFASGTCDYPPTHPCENFLVPQLPDGASCISRLECTSGRCTDPDMLACDVGTCAPPRLEGESCASSRDCGPLLTCLGSVCTRGFTTAPRGAACDFGVRCERYSTCVDGVCVDPAPLPRVGLGGFCGEGRVCGTALRCSEGFCVGPIPIGGSCLLFSQCVPEAYCLHRGSAVLSLPVSEKQRTSGTWVGSTQVNSSVGTCLARPGLGDPCAPGATCVSGAVCSSSSSTCVPGGVPGERCTISSDCVAGTCDAGFCEPFCF